MNFKSVRYTFDPRKVLSLKTESGRDPLDIIVEKLKENIKADRIIITLKSFNIIEAVLLSSEPLSEQAISEFNNGLPFEIDGKDIAFLEKDTTKDALLEKRDVLGEDNVSYITGLPSPSGEPVHCDVVDCSADNRKKTDLIDKPEYVDAALKKVYELIAMPELSAWAEEIVSMRKSCTNNDLFKKAVMNMSYLISVNPGNGCSTLLNSMNSIFSCCGLGKIRAVKEFYANPDQESKEYNIPEIINQIVSISHDSDKLYFFAIHIDKFQQNKHSDKWQKLLEAMWSVNKEAIFAFVVPYLEQNVLDDIHRRIDDVLSNRIIKVKPYSNADYFDFFKLYFSELKMDVNDNVSETLYMKISDEKNDGKFYGINTVYKIANEVLYNILQSGADSTTVSTESVKALFNSERKASEIPSGRENLERLIGLSEIKQKIREMVASIKLQQKIDNSPQCMHMMFKGAPGTGKTAVARILGQIFKEEGILSRGGFYEVSRKDLVGSYVGHTAPKTAEVCRLAYGSILFIDEAYLLCGGSDNDYGKEAIGTLIAEMENNRDKLIVIFAGYGEELDKLYELNPGLKSRIPYTLYFENYSTDELTKIFLGQVPDKFSYDTEFKVAVTQYFSELDTNLLDSRSFSNARFARNLLERVLSKAALRIDMDGSCDLSLNKTDFELAIIDKDIAQLNKKTVRKSIGF